MNDCEKLKNMESVEQTTEPHNTQLTASYYYACVHHCVCICTFLYCLDVLTSIPALFLSPNRVRRLTFKVDSVILFKNWLVKKMNSSFEFNFTWSGSPHGCCHVEITSREGLLLISFKRPTY